MLLFAMHSTAEFGREVAARLGVSLAEHEERAFEDGEHKTRPLVSVRGRDVYVLQSLYSDPAASVNDKLCRLLFFLGCLRDAGAGRVTALIPYLAYARKDRKTQPRDPVTTRYVAALFEAVRVDRIVTLDVHNLAAFQNAFRCPTEHLEANRLFLDHLAARVPAAGKLAVVSPDVGGIKRAERLREQLTRALQRDIEIGFLQKARGKGQLKLGRLVGEVAAATAIIVDDLIASGSTLAHAARACREAGARQCFALGTHGLFVGQAADALAELAIDQLIVTDTVPPFRLGPGPVRDKLTVLPATALFAEAVRRLHTHGSLVEWQDL